MPQVQSTLAKLSLCRTAALGNHQYRCEACEHESVVHNSCGDRHCPTCRGAKRTDWIDSTSRLILDGVRYYQVVFTLPSELSHLALGNRRPIYDLLFASAWSALKSTIQSEQGFDPAALMVLHTWNQKLDAHAHLHAVVPGGGPALDGSGWRVAGRVEELDSVGRYLVDAETLRHAYRDAFLRGLNRLHAAGKLRLEGDFQCLQKAEAWELFTTKLESASWVSHIQPPPRDESAPNHVLKYLARYLTGGPISDSRIVSADEHHVTFLAREGSISGGNKKQVPITISRVEFIRRWSLHVLPSGYTKTRRYGGYSNPLCCAYLELCSKQLEAANAPLSSDAAEFDPFESPGDDSSDPREFCPCCGHAMILQEINHRPSWRDIMASAARPHWYRRRVPPPNLPTGRLLL